MAKDPAFLFYPNDWVGGTMGMTFEEKGAYMELLMMQFNRGHMTEHMIGQTIGQLWVKVKVKFMQDDSGLWYNDRLDLEKDRRKNYVKSRNNNKEGKNKEGKYTLKENGHMTPHMEDVNESINTLHNPLHNKVKVNDENFLKNKNEKNGIEPSGTDNPQAESYFTRRNRELREIKAKRLAGIANSDSEPNGSIANG